MNEQPHSQQPKPPTAEDVRNMNIAKGDLKKKFTQPHPESMLDIHNAYITPQTGVREIKDSLMSSFVMTEDGEVVSLYDIFSALNPDTRLSNMTPEQEQYVQWALDMQLTCHQLKMPRSAFTADVLRASVTEPSLGRNGFLAKNIQTVRQQTEHLQTEVQKTPDRGFVANMFK